MSGMEVVAVIGTVAAVISAFENGHELVKKIKQKRLAKKKVLPPPALERSLVRGPQAVHDAYDSGVETYGRAFRVENDRIANDAFKDIIIQLQGTLLRHLVAAQDDDTINDFSMVVNASNSGRVKSVDVLNDMYMRMMPAASMPRMLTEQHQSGEYDHLSQAQDHQRKTSGIQTNISPSVVEARWNSPPNRSVTEMTSSTWSTHMSPSRSTLTGATPKSPQAQAIQLRPGMMNTMTLQTQMGATDHYPKRSVDADKAPFSGKTSGLRRAFTSQKPQEDTGKLSLISPLPFPLSPDTPSFSDSALSPTLQAVSPGIACSPQWLERTKSSPAKSVPVERRQRLNNGPKPKPQRAASTNTPIIATFSSSVPKRKSRKFSFSFGSSTNKSTKSERGSVCEGASLMRSGNDGMKLRNQSISMTGQGNYWTCINSMCCFEGGAVRRKDENKKTTWGFDDTIKEAHGVRYRWSFLAKSHTEISNSKSGYEFHCVFCISQNKRAVKRRGEDLFIQHVATHQGQRPDPFKMFLLDYIVGRNALDDEKFDVNLTASVERTSTAARPIAGRPELSIQVNEYDSNKENAKDLAGSEQMKQSQPMTWQDDRTPVKNGILIPSCAEAQSTNTHPLDQQPMPLHSKSLPIHLSYQTQHQHQHQQQPLSPPLSDEEEPPTPAQHEQDDPPSEYEEEIAIEEADEELDTYDPSDSSIHPAFRNRISIPDPWRHSYATITSQHQSGGGAGVAGGGRRNALVSSMIGVDE